MDLFSFSLEAELKRLSVSANIDQNRQSLYIYNVYSKRHAPDLMEIVHKQRNKV